MEKQSKSTNRVPGSFFMNQDLGDEHETGLPAGSSGDQGKKPAGGGENSPVFTMSMLMLCLLVLGGGAHYYYLTLQQHTPSEVCNNVDDNDNGQIDEDFDLLTDPDNCGVCGHVCREDQDCYKGHCLEKDILKDLNPSSTETRPQAADGPTDPENCGAPGQTCPEGSHCEGTLCKWDARLEWCTPTVEICDSVDNDCDDWIDDGFELRTDVKNCGVCGHSCGLDQHCREGVCSFNQPQPSCTPSIETCNGLDDNCDGQIDNGINLSIDPDNCGVCGHSCGSMQLCENGQCVIIPHSVKKCVIDTETCNGLDDNCDGTIDDGFILSSDRANCGECGNVCAIGDDCENGNCVPGRVLPTQRIPPSGDGLYQCDPFDGGEWCYRIMTF